MAPGRVLDRVAHRKASPVGHSSRVHVAAARGASVASSISCLLPEVEEPKAEEAVKIYREGLSKVEDLAL